ncbi:MAG: peptidoglycan bridge formation glycyltransferase FemA/FemB family protein [Patescibacteria group bacterium]
MPSLTPHICQSGQWGQFKTLMGTPAIQANGVQFTVHRIPKTPWSIGYAPRTDPDQIDYKALYLAGQRNNCLYIKIEPNAIAGTYPTPSNCRPSKAIFAPQTILLELTATAEELLASMHPKTRYNLNLAQRKGVRVVLAEGEKDVAEFIRLQKETAARQKFFLHPDSYYKTVFKSLHPEGMAYLLLAKISNQSDSREPDTTIAAWMLFRYGETLYYPYGGSDYEHRQLMASSLLMWEAIQLGKKIGCRIFDMWGACTDPEDPWYGFTRFKLGFGGKVINFTPTFDLVINPLLYPLITKADKLRWLFLKALKR